MKQDVITMTQKQLTTLDVINKAIGGFITVSEAASSLDLSERQIHRLKKKVRESGPASLVHQNSLRVPANAIPDDVVAKIVSLKQSDLLAGANFSHFQELLAEHHEIHIAYSTLYRILIEAGLRSPKTRRRPKPHRRRKRRPQAGLLLQVDATPFPWFQGNPKRYALHGAIDDATGQITGLYLCENECLLGYFNMLERTIHNYGIPVSLYADRHTIFQSPNKGKPDVASTQDIQDTQFGRCLRELGIRLHAARSPQAKGRIERLWQTLQGRLVVEFAIRSISTIEEANAFLSSYIYAFNSEFAVEPFDSDSMFLPPDPGLNLDYVLCTKETRTIDAGGVFSYKNKTFKAEETIGTGMIPSKAKVQVLSSPKFGVKLQYRKVVFEVSRFIPPKRQKAKAPVSLPQKHDPAPYKYWQEHFPRLVNDMSNQDILEMLEDIFLNKHA